MQIRFLPEADTDLAEARVWYGLQRRPVGPKDRKIPIKYSALSGLGTFLFCYQGRRAPLRFALAPGFHISRLRRSASLLSNG